MKICQVKIILLNYLSDCNKLDSIPFGLKHLVVFLSSVHELILMPSNPKNEDIPYLQKMVREINATVVAPDEWLSTNVYHYDREKDEVLILLPTEESYEYRDLVCQDGNGDWVAELFVMSTDYNLVLLYRRTYE